MNGINLADLYQQELYQAEQQQIRGGGFCDETCACVCCGSTQWQVNNDTAWQIGGKSAVADTIDFAKDAGPTALKFLWYLATV
jgi:hypothetical protein